MLRPKWFSPAGSPEVKEKLLADDGPVHSEELHAPQRSGVLARSVLFLAYLGCLVSSIYTIYMVLKRPDPIPYRSPIENNDELDRPSIYINLDKVHKITPIVPANQTLRNYPYGIFQVSYSEPDKVFPTDQGRWLTPLGSVSPDEDHVFISPDVSTIMQTRALDWGLERCTVAVEFPDEQTIRGRNLNNNLDLFGNTSELQVWLLDTHKELDHRTLSRNTLPPRKQLLGTFNMQLGKLMETPEFRCPSQGLITYELACPAHHCLVRYIQDKYPPVFAFYVRQHASV